MITVWIIFLGQNKPSDPLCCRLFVNSVLISYCKQTAENGCWASTQWVSAILICATALAHLNLTSSSPLSETHANTHPPRALIKSANEYSYPGHADPSAYAAIHLGVQMKSDLAASQSARSGALRMRGALAAWRGPRLHAFPGSPVDWEMLSLL